MIYTSALQHSDESKAETYTGESVSHLWVSGIVPAVRTHSGTNSRGRVINACGSRIPYYMPRIMTGGEG